MEGYDWNEDEEVKPRNDAELIKTRRSNWRSVLKSGAGQQVLFDILQECGIYEVGIAGDVNNLIFREGKKAVGVFIKELIEDTDSGAYHRLKGRQNG